VIVRSTAAPERFQGLRLVATPKEQLAEPEKAKKPATLKPEDLARMEHEMQTLQKDFLLIEERYPFGPTRR